MRKFALTFALTFALLTGFVTIVSAQSPEAFMQPDTVVVYDDYSPVGAGVFLFSTMFYLVCFCCSCTLPIIFALWVYTDAKKRNIDNPELWALIAFLLSIIGVVIYLVGPRSKSQEVQTVSSTSQNRED